MSEFTLKIKLGNAAMQDTNDVSHALGIVSRHVGEGKEHGFIMDSNGNRVGEYSMPEEE